MKQFLRLLSRSYVNKTTSVLNTELIFVSLKGSLAQVQYDIETTTRCRHLSTGTLELEPKFRREVSPDLPALVYKDPIVFTDWYEQYPTYSGVATTRYYLS